MVKALFITGVTLLIFPICRAQYFQFSQNNFTDVRISPAVVATTDYATMNAVFRNQRTGGDFNLNSSFISASYPFLNHKRKRWGGLGVSLMDDRSGGMFNIQEAALTYASNIYLDKFQTLAFGAKGMFRQHRVDAEGLTTGAQYLPGRGFDEGIFNGEAFDELQQTFFTLSLGAQWQQVDRDGQRVAYASFAVFDLNKPEDSFLGTSSTLRETVVGAFGFRVYESNDVSVFPELIYTRSYGEHTLNVGAVTRFEIRPAPNMPEGSLDVITRLVSGKGAIAGLQLHRDNFSVGFTYDFPVFERYPSNLGAIEVGLQLRRLVTPPALRISKKRKGKGGKTRRATTGKPQSEIVRDSTKPVVNPVPVVTDSTGTTTKRVPQPQLLPSDTISTRTSVGKVSHEPLAIEKTSLNFNFSLNSVALNEETRAYLDDVAAMMRENPQLRLRLTGHTDNIGSVAYNEKLSRHRAKAVGDYITALGISDERIVTDGKGMSEPIESNATAEGRASNRRVELVLEFRP